MVYEEHKFLYPCFKHSKNIATTCKGLTSLLKKTIENQKPATRTVQYMLKAINSQCMLDTNTYFSVATESFSRFSSQFYYMSKISFLSFTCSFFLFLLPIPQSNHCDNPRPNQIYFDNTSFSFTKWFSYIQFPSSLYIICMLMSYRGKLLISYHRSIFACCGSTTL